MSLIDPATRPISPIAIPQSAKVREMGQQKTHIAGLG